jgi:hypothetical protein
MSGQLAPPQCPQAAYTFTYKVVFPQGFDGGPVDAAILVRARAFHEESKETWETDYASSQGACDRVAPPHRTVSGTPFRASPKLAGVMWGWEEFYGGNHPGWGYVSQNMTAEDGTELTLGRLFPNFRDSLFQLWGIVYRGFCSQGKDTTPSFYGSQPCRKRPPRAPEQLSEPGNTLDAAGHAILSPQGLHFHLDPYEGYFWADGPKFLDIPKEKLLEIGADRLLLP